METLLIVIRILVFMIIVFTVYYLTKSIGKWCFRRIKDLGLFILRLPISIVLTINGFIERGFHK